MLMNNRFAFIELLYWGVSLNGEHYTAMLSFGDIRHELTFTLNTRQAVALNKKDGGRTHRCGMESGRFETKEAAIKAGIEWVKANASGVDVIFVGNAAYAEPHTVAWARNEAEGNKFRKLKERLDAFGNDPWVTHETEMDLLTDEWIEMIK